MYSVIFQTPSVTIAEWSHSQSSDCWLLATAGEKSWGVGGGGGLQEKRAGGWGGGRMETSRDEEWDSELYYYTKIKILGSCLSC